MEPKVIFEDSEILVLDKPSGWIVNEAATTLNQPVLQSWIKKNYKFETATLAEYRSGIVHRLDKETSGILIIAKTKESFSDLQRKFKEREIEKTYLTLVHGKLTPSQGSVSVPVGRLPWRRDRFGILPGGREAATDYKVRESFEKNGDLFSLAEVNPKTGRTHQIRIHFKYLGHPVVSDEFYAGRKTARKDRIWCPRLFLHATKIKFIHPKTDKKVEFSSELPEDLAKALSFFT